VRVIRREVLREFASAHRHAETEYTIFNIGGNKYRLATSINHRAGRVYIRSVMTHEEYSREDWKRR